MGRMAMTICHSATGSPRKVSSVCSHKGCRHTRTVSPAMRRTYLLRKVYLVTVGWRSYVSGCWCKDGVDLIGRRKKQRVAKGRAHVHCIAHGDHHHHHDSHHSGSCCSSSFDEAHIDNQDSGSAVSRGLMKVMQALGILKFASYLEHSRLSSTAKIVFFIAASIFQWSYMKAPEAVNAVLLRQLSVACTLCVYFFAGIPAVFSLLLDLAALRIDTHVLMNLAVVGTLVAGLPLEGALLLVLFQTSHAVEHMLTDKAQGSLKALFDSIPNHADVVDMGEDGQIDLSSTRHIPTSDVKVGETILVRPGCQVPIDGNVVQGQALVSAEHITGESIPSLKRPGDQVPAGSLCHDGALCVKTTRTSEDSTPARIAQLAKDAQAKRPRIRTFLEIYGEVYSKAVIGIAACAFLAMVASGVPVIGTAGTRGALYRAMGLLTVASPCALVLVPMAYVSAIAALATKGIILKGGRVLDAARKCRIIAMDKTGTLTTGTLKLQDVIPIDCEQASIALDSNDIMGVAKSLSLRSSHPVSDAVIAKANAMGLGNIDLNVEEFLLVPGGGVTGRVKVQDVLVTAKFGSQEFVAKELSERDVESIQTSIESQNMKNTILSFLVLEWKSKEGQNARSISLFQCEDTLRDASYQAVHSLLSGTWFNGNHTIKTDKCDVIMLTGDNEDSARKIASRVGIDHVYAGLSPDEKLHHIKTLGRERNQDTIKRSNSPVLMIGDGLNDAAALSAARVGVAISSPASAAASMASDVVVMNYKSGVASVPLLLRISRYTHRIVLQNVALAAGSILILALPTVLGFIPLWLAVMFHEGSTLLVALNSLRLLRFSL